MTEKNASDDVEYGDWVEEEQSSEMIPCLFSNDRRFSTFEKLCECLKKEYDLNFSDMLKSKDVYDRIRLVNWIRRRVSLNKESVEDIVKDIEKSTPPKDDESLLVPFLKNDPLLLVVTQFDDDDEDWSSSEEEQSKDDLSDQVRMLTQQLEKAKNLIRTLTKGETKLTKQDDSGYFGGYSHYSIHETMLKDRPRTESYRDALEACDLKGKIVLDVGCGTGILSMFAARHGAKHVIGIDRSDIIDEARVIVKQNGLEDRITLIKGKLEDIVLPSNIAPAGTVDLIVSEWMGYMLLFESMLPTVLTARDRWLDEKTGLLFPSRSTMSICAVSDQDMWNDRITYWKDVYGFDMRNIRSHILREPMVEVLEQPEKCVVSKHYKFSDLDLNTVKNEELDFESTFEMLIEGNSGSGDTVTVHALLIWFDVSWPVPKVAPLTTAPEAEPTHWKQTILLLQEPLKCVGGKSKLVGKIKLQRGKSNEREYGVNLTYRLDGDEDSVSCEYYMAA